MMQRATVLLVDDDQDAVETMRDILVEEGHDVRCAANGREALEMARASTPDVVLLDLDMPVMDGREFLAIARAEPGLRDVPVFVISGASDAASVNAESIEKPLRLDTLLGVISRVRKSVPPTA